MSSFIDKIKDAIFDSEPVHDEDNDIIDEQDGYEEALGETIVDERESRADRRKQTNAGGSKVVNMDKPNLTAVNGTGTMKMILFQPLSFEDSQAIVDNLRARKPVIVNMVDLERELAQRVIDFMSGAVYALSGTIRRVSYGIFVIVPSNITIVGDGEDEERDLFR